TSHDGVRLGQERTHALIDKVHRLFAKCDSTISIEGDNSGELVSTESEIDSLGLENIGSIEVAAEACDGNGSINILSMICSCEGHDVYGFSVFGKSRGWCVGCRLSALGMWST